MTAAFVSVAVIATSVWSAQGTRFQAIQPARVPPAPIRNRPRWRAQGQAYSDAPASAAAMIPKIRMSEKLKSVASTSIGRLAYRPGVKEGVYLLGNEPGLP